MSSETIKKQREKSTFRKSRMLVQENEDLKNTNELLEARIKQLEAKLLNTTPGPDVDPETIYYKGKPLMNTQIREVRVYSEETEEEEEEEFEEEFTIRHIEGLVELHNKSSKTFYEISKLCGKQGATGYAHEALENVREYVKQHQGS